MNIQTSTTLARNGLSIGWLRIAVKTGLLLALGGLFTGTCGAAQGLSLQNMEYRALPGDRVLVTLTLSDDAPQPVVFTVDKPARVALDLPDTRVTMSNRYSKINIGNTRAIAAAEAKGRSRVVVELVQLAPYDVSVKGNKIYIQLGNAGDTALSPYSPGGDNGIVTASAAPRPRASVSRIPEGISKIDFRRGEKGEAQVLITLTNPTAPVNVHEQGGKVIAEFSGTALPDSLVKRLDVLDFATPAKYVDAVREGGTTKIIVTPVAGAKFEQVAYQAGNQYTLELQPFTPEKLAEQKDKPKYTGERVSLSFQNVDVRALLQIIADVAGVNMVVSDSVSGSVALRLQNVPWDQALDIILTTKNLGMQREGNVILVAPTSEIAARERAALEAAQAKTVLDPLRSEIIQVNFAKASEIATLLQNRNVGAAAGGNNNAAGGAGLSSRGSVSVDERTNTMIVQDTAAKIEEIRKLVAQLDIPVRQVLIESRIVIANDDYERDLGARFGVTTAGSSNGTKLLSTGSAEGTDVMTGGAVPALNNRFNVNLPAAPSAGTAGKIALAILGSDYLVDLELSALQVEGRGEIISTPRILTANGKEASIEQGVEIPYQQASSSGATTVSFKDAVLKLSVTPQITPDDHIIMDLNISKDDVGKVISDTLGGSIPSIDKRKITSQVLVNNGETVVLGGIYEQTNTNNTSKIPLLGDVPLLGVLFRQNAKIAQKKELLIFVTPKILKEGLAINNK